MKRRRVNRYDSPPAARRILWRTLRWIAGVVFIALFSFFLMWAGWIPNTGLFAVLVGVVLVGFFLGGEFIFAMAIHAPAVVLQKKVEAAERKLCPDCLYPLTGAAGTCPECGIEYTLSDVEKCWENEFGRSRYKAKAKRATEPRS